MRPTTRVKLAEFWARLHTLNVMDANDWFFFVGLVAVVVGVWHLSHAWSEIIGGSILMVIGLFGLGGKHGGNS